MNTSKTKWPFTFKNRVLCKLFGHKRRKRAVSKDASTDILVCPRCMAMWEAKPRAPKMNVTETKENQS